MIASTEKLDTLRVAQIWHMTEIAARLVLKVLNELRFKVDQSHGKNLILYRSMVMAVPISTSSRE